MIYGIDFDGTIVEEKFPEIDKPIERVVDFIRDLQAKGHKWVLITMREGKYLDDAVAWLKSHELTPDAVNDNLPERIEKWGNNPRKVYADIYIDDHNAGGVQLPIISNLNFIKSAVWGRKELDMKNKTCGECCGFSESENRCLLLGGRGKTYADNEACRRFSEKKPIPPLTNGDKIIAGGMRAIAELAKNRCLHCIYKNSDYIKTCLEVDCADGIEAWLNAPAGSEGEDE